MNILKKMIMQDSWTQSLPDSLNNGEVQSQFMNIKLNFNRHYQN